MTKIKIEKFLVISFIGLIITFFVGLGGNIVLKAGLPTSTSVSGVNFEKRLRSLEYELATEQITRHQYDSLVNMLRSQKQQEVALTDKNINPDKMPGWVTKLGITEPSGLKFDPIFSNSTTVDDPSEGFNSVSMVYTGTFEQASSEAAKIASKAKLKLGGVFLAKGSPNKNEILNETQGISYLNYSLGNTNLDFLISVRVDPSGKLTIMVTDNKQLNSCLLAYEPLNNRQNSASKRKKQ